MKKLVWICIFSAISIIPILTSIRIVSLQDIYNTKDSTPITTYNERGPIFDRNGNILAMQITSWNVGLRLMDTNNADEVIKILSSTLNIPFSELQNTLISTPQRYIRVKKFISKKEYNALMEYKTAGKLYGVQINTVPWRQYPGNDSMAHVIGYYGEDGNGLDGIESSYNTYLKPDKKHPIGNSVYVTIDSVLQKSIEEILKATLESSQSSYITTILMDAKTGDILAYVELPSFNLNSYYTYTQNNLSNKIVSAVYEPGSVFKIFSLASAFDAGIINEYTTFDASMPYVDPHYNFTITDINYHGIINTSEIIKYSSNVGISLATYNMDKTLLYQYLNNFGFGKKTGLKLPGESVGVFQTPKYWSARSKQTIALGQEIGITAMQIITAATAIANEGKLLQPNLVKKIVSPKGKILYEHTPQYTKQVVSAHTANALLQMMYSATEGGTARRIKVEGINISAKTGTAQVFDIEKKAYSETDFIASTLAIVPTEDPKLIVYSVIHKPTAGSTYGGRTTAPMIKTIFDFALPYLGLVGEKILVKQDTNPTTNTNTIQSYTDMQTFENYFGMSKREVWTLFANSHITVNLHGEGYVIKQSPPPGTSLQQSNTIDLYLQ